MDAPKNQFWVGTVADDVSVARLNLRLTKAEALALAAWLVATAGDDGKRFAETLAAVRGAVPA